MNTVIEAYRKVIAESAEELTNDPAEVFSENLNCSIEEADMIMLQLSTLGMGEDDMLKIAKMFRLNEYDSEQNEIIEVCSKWMQLWNDNKSLALDDVKSFDMLKFLTFTGINGSKGIKDYECAEIECNRIAWHIKNPQMQKIAKAVMWNMSIDAIEGCVYMLYKDLKSKLIKQDIIESLTARLKSVESYEEAVSLSILAKIRLCNDVDDIQMNDKILNALIEKKDLICSGKEGCKAFLEAIFKYSLHNEDRSKLDKLIALAEEVLDIYDGTPLKLEESQYFESLPVEDLYDKLERMKTLKSLR